MLQTDTARRLDAALPELHPDQLLWIALQAERLAERQKAANARNAARNMTQGGDDELAAD